MPVGHERERERERETERERERVLPVTAFINPARGSHHPLSLTQHGGDGPQTETIISHPACTHRHHTAYITRGPSFTQSAVCRRSQSDGCRQEGFALSNRSVTQSDLFINNRMLVRPLHAIISRYQLIFASLSPFISILYYLLGLILAAARIQDLPF